jgi:cytochrome P450
MYVNGSLSIIYQTVAALMSFFAAMLLYPDIQKKAQDELDSVIGRERLPTFEDRSRLPFIDAACKEILRWHPVTPLGTFPRCLYDERHHTYNIVTGSCSTCDRKR